MKFWMSMTILSLLVAATSAHAFNNYYEQAAFRDIDVECRQRVGFNERAYKEAKARGLSDADATDYGYAKTIDEGVYNQLLTDDLRESVAYYLATSFEYANNEKFCKEYREQFNKRLKKFRRHSSNYSI